MELLVLLAPGIPYDVTGRQCPSQRWLEHQNTDFWRSRLDLSSFSKCLGFQHLPHMLDSWSKTAVSLQAVAQFCGHPHLLFFSYPSPHPLAAPYVLCLQIRCNLLLRACIAQILLILSKVAPQLDAPAR